MYNKEYGKYWRKNNKKKIKIYKKLWQEENKKHCQKYGKNYRERNKDKMKKLIKLWKEKNKIKIKKYRKLWEKKNSFYRKKYHREKYNEDINFKLTCCLRSRLNHALKQNSKSKPTINLLGCTIEQFKQYLQKQFREGMSWKNWSRKGWHIDHIKPCSLFDLSKPKEQKKCFNYRNLQPLWAKDNFVKHR